MVRAEQRSVFVVRVVEEEKRRGVRLGEGARALWREKH